MIEKQTEILQCLCQILHDEAEGHYDSLEVTYEVIGNSVDSIFSFIRNGKLIRKGISAKNSLNTLRWVLELHSCMDNHTGGRWKSMRLILDESGKVKTGFDY